MKFSEILLLWFMNKEMWSVRQPPSANPFSYRVSNNDFWPNYLFYFLDSIESHVESAVVHVEDANVQLHKASNYQVLSIH